MAKKNTIRLTESDLKKIISESVKKVLKEDTERVINVEYDENTSFSKGRKYYYCHDNGRYYTNIDGEWYICTDNYYLEPDVHVDPNVKIITESVKKVLNEGFYPDEIYGAGASWDGFADEEPPIVPIRFGEQNRPKFKKMTDEAYHLLQELRYNVATKEQKDEIVQAMKLVRHACMGR